MPLYDYQCETCLEIFEMRASIKEKEAGLVPECPVCHSKATRQVITAGLVLRGSNNVALSFPACGPSAKPGCCG